MLLYVITGLKVLCDPNPRTSRLYKAAFSYQILILPIVIISFVLFFLGGPSHYSSLSFQLFWNVGHILFFYLTSYYLLTILKQKSSLWLVMLYALVLGGTIELIQGQIGRNIDWLDLYRDLLGALLAIAVWLYRKHQKSLLHLIFLVATCLLITSDQIMLFKAIKLEINAYSNMPILAEFNDNDELMLWTGDNLSLSTEYANSAKYSLKVILTKGGKYSGFTYKHFNNDWTGYKVLVIHLYNANKENIELCIKVTDYIHDISKQNYFNRFNRCVEVTQGKQEIQILITDIIQAPKNREFDISDISQIGFFMSDLVEDKLLYIQRISLK
jgi:hypothetical protein